MVGMKKGLLSTLLLALTACDGGVPTGMPPIDKFVEITTKDSEWYKGYVRGYEGDFMVFDKKYGKSPRGLNRIRMSDIQAWK